MKTTRQLVDLFNGLDLTIGPPVRLPAAEPVDSFTGSLPWPPSINHYWRRVGAKTLISAEGRRYRTTIGESRQWPRITGPLRFAATFYPPDKRRRDLDNLLKALLDALQAAGLYEDDSQIRHIDIRFGACRAGGAVEVVVSKL